jgi:hypothetical protein
MNVQYLVNSYYKANNICAVLPTVELLLFCFHAAWRRLGTPGMDRFEMIENIVRIDLDTRVPH